MCASCVFCACVCVLTQLPSQGHLFYSGKGDENKRATNFARAQQKITGDAIYVLGTHGFHLYNMLRPEWVRESPVPLSSGAHA